MPERDIDTEPLIRRTPSECTRPGAPCLYEQDRDTIAAASRRLERKMDGLADSLADIRSTLASGSVRFETLADIPKRVASVEASQQTALSRLSTVERIVYCVCGAIGLAVIGAVMSLILKAA